MDAVGVEQTPPLALQRELVKAVVRKAIANIYSLFFFSLYVQFQSIHTAEFASRRVVVGNVLSNTITWVNNN